MSRDCRTGTFIYGLHPRTRPRAPYQALPSTVWLASVPVMTHVSVRKLTDRDGRRTRPCGTSADQLQPEAEHDALTMITAIDARRSLGRCRPSPLGDVRPARWSRRSRRPSHHISRRPSHDVGAAVHPSSRRQHHESEVAHRKGGITAGLESVVDDRGTSFQALTSSVRRLMADELM